MAEQQTTTRETLSERWLAARKNLDWMHTPDMPNYVNRLVSGKSLPDGGHWAQYVLEKHLAPLARRRGQKLSMVTLGCGSAYIEKSLIEDFLWPIGDLLGLEYDAELRRSATESFQALPITSAFAFYDFNAERPADRQYDVVFCCHAIHHATDLEVMLPTVNAMLKDDGLFVGIEYFGPTRFQIEHDVRPIIEELYDILPAHLKRDLREDDMPVAPRFPFSRIDDVAADDPSEAVRSSDLRTLLLANFPILDLRPMGGTVLRWLLQNRAGNFNHADPDHIAIARLLQMIERILIESRMVRSDDLLFVLGKSDRLDKRPPAEPPPPPPPPPAPQVSPLRAWARRQPRLVAIWRRLRGLPPAEALLDV